MNLVVTDPKQSKNVKGTIEGVIVINAKNDEVGSIMFREDKASGLELGKSFSGSTKPRVAFHTDNLEALRAYVKDNELTPGTKVKGYKIIIEESTKPFYDGQSVKMNPNTAETVTHKGQDIYRLSVIVPENSERSDSLLTNDTVGSAVAKEIENIVNASEEIN